MLLLLLLAGGAVVVAVDGTGCVGACLEVAMAVLGTDLTTMLE